MRRTLLLIALLFGPLSHAGQFYLGGQIGYYDLSAEGQDVTPVGINLQGGYRFSPFVGLELRAGTGISRDDAASVEVGVEHNLGAYLNAGVPLSDWVRLYGLLGYTTGEVEISVSGQSRTQQEQDLSYGAGFGLGATEQLSVTIEYMQWIDKGGVDVSGLTLGVIYLF
ncbi:porin family protein [Ferrimonas marina]|uniref:Opacity protein n=1 Tax=Ferrimonas marina TaxID=299255 RepID=A0A1M5XQI3_9GAMM|nr:porin family protein [Ferrimonas marina]SHI02081.1 Opacity protein [Ferrimonas marina]